MKISRAAVECDGKPTSRFSYIAAVYITLPASTIAEKNNRIAISYAYISH